MARSATSSLLLSLLLAALAAPRSSAFDDKDINAACEYMTVPQLCRALAAKTSAKNVNELLAASIAEALSKAEEACDTVSRVTAAPITDQRLKANLAICSTSFVSAVESLNQAAVQHGAGDHSAVVRSVSVTVEHVVTCNDVFSENPGLVSPVADLTSIIRKLTSNTLGLAVAIDLKARAAHYSNP